MTPTAAQRDAAAIRKLRIENERLQEKIRQLQRLVALYIDPMTVPDKDTQLVQEAYTAHDARE